MIHSWVNYYSKIAINPLFLGKSFIQPKKQSMLDKKSINDYF